MESLPPKYIQIAGLIGLAGCLAFWMVTGKVASEFITAFGGLTSSGLVLSALRKDKEPEE
jgi:hypothetical protein